MIVTLLLDESGSMSPYRDSTIKSINENGTADHPRDSAGRFVSK